MPCQWTRQHAPISSLSWPALWWRSFTRRGEETMTEVLYNPKIKPEHLARKAIVYLRQSSEKQVRQNKESQLLQYARIPELTAGRGMASPSDGLKGAAQVRSGVTKSFFSGRAARNASLGRSATASASPVAAVVA